MGGVLLTLIGAVFFGFLFVGTRAGLVRAPDPEAGAFLTDSVGLAASAAVALAAGASVRHVSAASLWPLLVSGAVAPGLSQILFVRAVRAAGPSRTSVVIATTPLASAVVAIVLLGEPFRPTLLAGTVAVVGGVVALSWERTRPEGFRVIGLWLALASVLFYVARDNLVRWEVSGHARISPLIAATAMLASASATTGVYLALARGAALPGLVRRGLVPFLPAGLAIGIGYAALTAAFARARVTVVAPLNTTYVLWTLFFSALLIGRPEAIGRRLVLAVALVVGGAALVGTTR